MSGTPDPRRGNEDLSALMWNIDDKRGLAAVALLADACRGTWLRRMCDDATVRRFVTVVEDYGAPYAVVDWDALGAAIDANQVIGSSGELRVLAVACSLGGGHRVNLRFAFSGLDEANRSAVAEALGSVL